MSGWGMEVPDEVGLDGRRIAEGVQRARGWRRMTGKLERLGRGMMRWAYESREVEQGTQKYPCTRVRQSKRG